MALSKEEKKERLAELKKKEIYHKELVAKQNQNIANNVPYTGDAFIALEHINKIYPNHVQAVFDFNLEIKEKEFIVFVGPSGCGKSTTLRMIAGLEDITYGNLYFDKVFGNTLLPKQRDCAMVFQSYALYPNMTVFDNMAFSLKIRHNNKEEIKEKVLRAAEILELTPYLGRKPGELSGGQRQRVALGRAIVRDAKIFLMDEPLSNLDAKLRVQMRSEIVALHEKIGSTTIYVTHDQTEAMTMADRIVVMKDGYVQQIGTPKEIYNKPSNLFVATFIGSPAMNLVNVRYSNGIITLPIIFNSLRIKLSKEQENELISSLTKEIELYTKEYEELERETNRLKAGAFDPNNKIYNSLSFKKRIPDIIELNKTKMEELTKKIDTLKEMKSTNTFGAKLGIRPEDIVSEKASVILSNKSNVFPLYINQCELLGNEYFVYNITENNKIIAKVSANEDVKAKTQMNFCINTNNIHLFDNNTGKRLF